MQGCHCDACSQASRTYHREWRLRTGITTGNREGKYSRCGVRVETVLPDLEMLLKVHGSQRQVARVLGIDFTSLNRVLRRGQKRVHLNLAMHIAEAVRGGRGLDKEWAKQEQRRAIEAARFQRDPELYKNRHKAKWAGDIECALCDWRGGTEHALYLHSVRVHDDRTQGQHVWVTKRRVMT